MLHVHRFLSLQKTPISISSFSPIINNHRIPNSRSQLGFCDGEFRKRGTNFHAQAVDKDSEFEVDPDKAREALRQLDQQLQSLSQKQINPPKKRASDLVNVKGDNDMRETTREISESLPYLAFGLLLFTIFYNVLFITVIKPSVDGPEPVLSSSDVDVAPRMILREQFPPPSKVLVQP